MIQFNMQPNETLLELGGGNNRHPQAHFNVDVMPGPKVDFVWNFDDPLPSEFPRVGEWSAVYCSYCIEHISWRNVKRFIEDVFTLVIPGGQVLIITANTPAQIEFIKRNQSGWDGKPAFESFSCVLFGDQDYPSNTHKNYMSIPIITDLFLEAGFADCKGQPFGERATDLLLQARKPGPYDPVTAQKHAIRESCVVTSKEMFDELCRSEKIIVEYDGMVITKEGYPVYRQDGSRVMAKDFMKGESK